MAKLASSLGRICGLPLPSLAGLPKEDVSQTELAALRSFEALAGEIGVTANGEMNEKSKSAKHAKAVTGKAYKVRGSSHAAISPPSAFSSFHSLHNAPPFFSLRADGADGRFAFTPWQALRQLLDQQCHDKELLHCDLKKARGCLSTRLASSHLK